MLDLAVILQRCSQAHMPLQTCQQVAVIDSTNRALSDILLHADTLPGWHFLLADAQTQGRGQRGKSWISPGNGNWYFSLGHLSIHSLETFVVPESMLIGQIVLQVFESFGVKPLALKSPNDILYQQRKLAGILIENHWQGARCYASVIGVGVNVGAHVEMQKIDQPWSCIEEVLSLAQFNQSHCLAQLMITIMQACSPKT
jgi:BirA family biotin operon repressor/biotin-[acetyl-CoA-carboxylase] ligase